MSFTVSDVIVNAASANKFLDFKDSLNPANQEDYAMLHGAGGKDHAMISTITALITDYSAGTGAASVSVKANLPPHIFDVIKTACEANMTKQSVPVDGFWGFIMDACAIAQQTYNEVTGLAKAVPLFFKGIINAAATAVTGGEKDKALAYLGKAAKYAKEEAEKRGEAAVRNPLLDTGCAALPVYKDYFYSQTRVNSYKKLPDGKVPVSTCTISRESRKKGGSLATLPWSVAIRNFNAFPRVSAKGTTAYDSKTISDKQEAFISLSDEDMHRCCYAVSHYIAVFENAVCIPTVRNGLVARRQERETWKAQQAGLGAASQPAPTPPIPTNSGYYQPR